jgi:hypothetical protein
MEIDPHLIVVEYSIILQTKENQKILLLIKLKSNLTIHGLSRKLYNAFIELTPGTAPYCIPRIILVQSILISRTYCRTSIKSGRNELLMLKEKFKK